MVYVMRAIFPLADFPLSLRWYSNHPCRILWKHKLQLGKIGQNTATLCMYIHSTHHMIHTTGCISVIFDRFWSLKWVSRTITQLTNHTCHPYFYWYFYQNHINLHALNRIMWVLDLIWPSNQHFKLENQRNRLNKFWYTSNGKILEVWFVGLSVLNEEIYFRINLFSLEFWHLSGGSCVTP